MKTAPAMPPPRPPRGGNFAMDSDDRSDNPNGGLGSRWLRYGRTLAKFLVLLLFAIAVGQVGLILVQIVRLQFFS